MADRPPFVEIKLTSPRLGSPDNPHYADTIAWLQDLLNRRALGKYMKAPVEVDGIFGAETAYELASFLYRMGRPGPELPAIGIDGESALWFWDNGDPLPDAWRATRIARLADPFKVGSGIAKRTWRLLHPDSYPAPTPPLKDGLDIALDWAVKGYKEYPAGSNHVPPLESIAHDLGVNSSIARMGYAWCAFNYFLAHLKAGHPVAKEALVKVSFWPLYTPTLDQYARAGKHGLRAVSADAAKPGDAVLFNFDGGVIDHIGMFMRHEGGNVVTCDGNSSVFGSQSNGGMCVVRSRPRSQAVTYFTMTA